MRAASGRDTDSQLAWGSSHSLGDLVGGDCGGGEAVLPLASLLKRQEYETQTRSLSLGLTHTDVNLKINYCVNCYTEPQT